MSAASPGSDLDRELVRLSQRSGVPHAVLHVERHDGSFTWAGAAGVARSDGAPMTTATPFNIAGIDKVFTAAAILRLYERNLIELDAPITSCLPTALTQGLNRRGGTDYASQITVRHLACHTSGIASYLDEAPRGGESVAQRIVAEGDIELSPGALLNTPIALPTEAVVSPPSSCSVLGYQLPPAQRHHRGRVGRAGSRCRSTRGVHAGRTAAHLVLGPHRACRAGAG